MRKSGLNECWERNEKRQREKGGGVGGKRGRGRGSSSARQIEKKIETHFYFSACPHQRLNHGRVMSVTDPWPSGSAIRQAALEPSRAAAHFR